MIRRLALKNWRNYEAVTLSFEAGTTFVVASNGVGKTSLVEAARWALFGPLGSNDRAPIRAGASSASATVELELPDLRILTVERTLTGKPRSARQQIAVYIDGAPVRSENLSQHLISAYGSDPGFLARLTMPAAGQDYDRPSAYGLEDHLGRYYGIDDLQAAADQLRTKRRSSEARIKRIKDVNSASSQRLAQLRADVEQTARRVEAATEGHRAAQARADRARERQRLQTAVQKWHQERSAWLEAAERLAVRVSADLGRPVTTEGIEAALDERLAHLDRQIESVRVEIAVNETRAEALTANEERLHAAHGDCPICRRPLDEATVAFAHEANAQELSVIQGVVFKLKSAESELLAHRDRARAVQTELRGIPRPGEPPRAPQASDDETVPAAELAAALASDELVEARTAHAQATQELDKARSADEAMRELESLFKQEASLRVAVEATEATLKELLNDTIRPLAIEIGWRWKALFPGRGDITTYSDGNITRMVNGQSLPYDSFSTAESIGATILLRLLVTSMATTANFCWFDEPLEHLDPDVRRQVAILLSRVTSEGPLRQVVVTTYEEPLVRHLRDRDERNVTLLDVRQAG